MIPSANRAIRPSPPPENRFRSPKIPLPLSRSVTALIACALMPGAGMCVPSRYSPRTAAVNRTLFRISPTLNAPRIVEIMVWPSRLDQLTGAAGRFDRLARGFAEAVRVDGQRLGELALGENLHGHALARRQALRPHRVERHGRAGIEARLEVEQV